jgi:hypothetical protein
VADLGTLPSAAPGVQVTVGALFGPVRAEVSGIYWGGQDASYDVTNEGTNIHLLEGTLHGCFRWRPVVRFEVDPCLGAGLVYATSDGFGGATTFDAYKRWSYWADALGDVLAVWRVLGPVGLRASLGGAVPLARPPFVVLLRQGSSVPLHQANVVSGRVTLGVEAHFP